MVNTMDDQTIPTPAVAPQPVVTEAHGENKQTVTPSLPETQAPVHEENREANKMSQLERERNEAIKKLQEIEEENNRNKQAINAFNTTYGQSREAYEVFRKEYSRISGEELPPYDNVYGTNDTTAPKATKAVPQSDDIEKVVERKIVEVQSKNAELAAIQAFADAHPELLTTDSMGRKQMTETFTKLLPIADGFRNGYGYDAKQALEEAFASLPENRGKILSQATEEGELVGAARTLAKGVGAMAAPSGSGSANIPQSENVAGLNQSEIARYKQLKAEGRDDYANKFKDAALRNKGLL